MSYVSGNMMNPHNFCDSERSNKTSNVMNVAIAENSSVGGAENNYNNDDESDDVYSAYSANEYSGTIPVSNYVDYRKYENNCNKDKYSKIREIEKYLNISNATNVCSLRVKLWEALLLYINKFEVGLIEFIINCLDDIEIYWGNEATDNLKEIKNLIHDKKYKDVTNKINDTLSSLSVITGKAVEQNSFFYTLIVSKKSNTRDNYNSDLTCELNKILKYECNRISNKDANQKLEYKIIEVNNAEEALLACLINSQILSVVLVDNLTIDNEDIKEKTHFNVYNENHTNEQYVGNLRNQCMNAGCNANCNVTCNPGNNAVCNVSSGMKVHGSGCHMHNTQAGSMCKGGMGGNEVCGKCMNENASNSSMGGCGTGGNAVSAGENAGLQKKNKEKLYMQNEYEFNVADFVVGYEKLVKMPIQKMKKGYNALVILIKSIAYIRRSIDIFCVCTSITLDKLNSVNNMIIRIFTTHDDHSDLHESILDGVKKKIKTPFFNALKSYAERPIGVFHALAISKGNSVRRSRWIQSLLDFYGVNLFNAESSATCGGLDSLLDPHGSLKEAQIMAAQTFGSKYCFFVTNGTSSSNKIVMQALVKPGDIILVDRACHKSHHYGFVLSQAFPCYLDPYPISRYGIYGAVPIYVIKRTLLNYRDSNKLHLVKMLILTNCTFDGIVYNVKRVMEECLAIKPDLIFLFDEAWFAYACFHPILKFRTAMTVSDRMRNKTHKQIYYKIHKKLLQKFGNVKSLNEVPAEKLLKTRLYPNPSEYKIRVYATQSIHKSLTSLRQGSAILISDDNFESDAYVPFKEAYYTHMSTSPNYQILATLDAGRAQMELEGYSLVEKQIEAALLIRKELSEDPMIRRYFRTLNAEDMIPETLRQCTASLNIGSSLDRCDDIGSKGRRLRRKRKKKVLKKMKETGEEHEEDGSLLVHHKWSYMETGVNANAGNPEYINGTMGGTEWRITNNNESGPANWSYENENESEISINSDCIGASKSLQNSKIEKITIRRMQQKEQYKTPGSSMKSVSHFSSESVNGIGNTSLSDCECVHVKGRHVNAKELCIYPDELSHFFEYFECSWLSEDEFVLDPTRITLFTGYSGIDGNTFKVKWLMDKYGIQINKTSVNTVLFQTNIGTTGSSCLFLKSCLSLISQELDQKKKLFNERDLNQFNDNVYNLVSNYIELSEFSEFHPLFKAKDDNPNSFNREGDLRKAFYLSYEEDYVQYILLDDLKERMKQNELIVSASFIIPYPPGFPVLVPGQVMSQEIVDNLAAISVKEIHGYDENIGFRCFYNFILDYFMNMADKDITYLYRKLDRQTYNALRYMELNKKKSVDNPHEAANEISWNNPILDQEKRMDVHHKEHNVTFYEKGNNLCDSAKYDIIHEETCVEVRNLINNSVNDSCAYVNTAGAETNVMQKWNVENEERKSEEIISKEHELRNGAENMMEFRNENIHMRCDMNENVNGKINEDSYLKRRAQHRDSEFINAYNTQREYDTHHQNNANSSSINNNHNAVNVAVNSHLEINGSWNASSGVTCAQLPHGRSTKEHVRHSNNEIRDNISRNRNNKNTTSSITTNTANCNSNNSMNMPGNEEVVGNAEKPFKEPLLMENSGDTSRFHMNAQCNITPVNTKEGYFYTISKCGEYTNNPNYREDEMGNISNVENIENRVTSTNNINMTNHNYESSVAFFNETNIKSRTSSHRSYRQIKKGVNNANFSRHRSRNKNIDNNKHITNGKDKDIICSSHQHTVYNDRKNSKFIEVQRGHVRNNLLCVDDTPYSYMYKRQIQKGSGTDSSNSYKQEGNLNNQRSYMKRHNHNRDLKGFYENHQYVQKKRYNNNNRQRHKNGVWEESHVNTMQRERKNLSHSIDSNCSNGEELEANVSYRRSTAGHANDNISTNKKDSLKELEIKGRERNYNARNNGNNNNNTNVAMEEMEGELLRNDEKGMITFETDNPNNTNYGGHVSTYCKGELRANMEYEKKSAHAPLNCIYLTVKKKKKDSNYLSDLMDARNRKGIKIIKSDDGAYHYKYKEDVGSRYRESNITYQNRSVNETLKRHGKNCYAEEKGHTWNTNYKIPSKAHHLKDMDAAYVNAYYSDTNKMGNKEINYRTINTEYKNYSIHVNSSNKHLHGNFEKYMNKFTNPKNKKKQIKSEKGNIATTNNNSNNNNNNTNGETVHTTVINNITINNDNNGYMQQIQNVKENKEETMHGKCNDVELEDGTVKWANNCVADNKYNMSISLNNEEKEMHNQKGKAVTTTTIGGEKNENVLEYENTANKEQVTSNYILDENYSRSNYYYRENEGKNDAGLSSKVNDFDKNSLKGASSLNNNSYINNLITNVDDDSYIDKQGMMFLECSLTNSEINCSSSFEIEVPTENISANNERHKNINTNNCIASEKK